MIAFNTANLVARVTDWKFTLSDWGRQDRLTRERTDETAWGTICAEISAAGFRKIEVWAAHVDAPQMTDARAATFRKVMADNGLTPIGFAGPLNDETARVCQQLGITVANGGYWGSDKPTVARLLKSTGIAFNYENHPEKSAAEILAQIEGLGAPDAAGVALDTGWLGTHHLDGAATVKALGKKIRHVHLKDVKSLGGHETVPLGTGVVNIPAVVAALKAVGFSGAYSWEDEPEDRNPMAIAKEMREYIEGLVG